jgi:2,3,4,5-tetrahydropyridine-2,6-dicarboxylate N-succinyltransferase
MYLSQLEREQLEREIDRHFAAGPAAANDPAAQTAAMTAFLALRSALEAGEVRAAEPDAASASGWRVNAWVKRGILLGFRLGTLEEMPSAEIGSSGPAPALTFVDKHTYPARRFTAADGVRVVPGGSSVRAGAYVARGVVCMPPMYINAGAYVDEGTLVDSHALVGSCAQIGKRVHLSAAAQIGGVLEPVNASPVIIEDDVLVGGNCGVYEGAIVRKGAVLAAGVILTRGTPLFDLVNGTSFAPPPTCRSSSPRMLWSCPARARSTKARAIPKPRPGASAFTPPPSSSTATKKPTSAPRSKTFCDKQAFAPQAVGRNRAAIRQRTAVCRV